MITKSMSCPKWLQRCALSTKYLSSLSFQANLSKPQTNKHKKHWLRTHMLNHAANSSREGRSTRKETHVNRDLVCSRTRCWMHPVKTDSAHLTIATTSRQRLCVDKGRRELPRIVRPSIRTLSVSTNVTGESKLLSTFHCNFFCKELTFLQIVQVI